MMLAWLPPETPALSIAIADRVFQDIGMCETPPSSNRGGRIDSYNQRAGAPLGSYWCASEATACYVDAGARVPDSGRASCQTLMEWAVLQGIWFNAPVVGAMVIYGSPDGHGGWKLNAQGHHAHHVGIIVRLVPYLLACEGNSSWGGGFTSNGEAVVMRRVDLNRVLGFLHPWERDGG